MSGLARLQRELGIFDPSPLEAAILKRIDNYLDRAWRPNINNALLAEYVTLLCQVLRDAGHDPEPVHGMWKARYDIYKLDGGRAKYQELRGFKQ